MTTAYVNEAVFDKKRKQLEDIYRTLDKHYRYDLENTPATASTLEYFQTRFDEYFKLFGTANLQNYYFSPVPTSNWRLTECLYLLTKGLTTFEYRNNWLEENLEVPKYALSVDGLIEELNVLWLNFINEALEYLNACIR